MENEQTLTLPRNRSMELQSADINGGPAVSRMLQKVIDGGVTKENVEVMGKMLDFLERVQTKDAEKSFARAFIDLQGEMPVIHASKPVPDKFGNVKYVFAPYEDIMAQVKPLLQKHGFTLSFSMAFMDGRVIQTCTLMHKDGHSRDNQFMARVGNGPPGSSEAQGDGAASTYAKRFALCDALNITIERDEDARREGRPVTRDEAMYLRELVRETKSDEAKFLKYAGAPTYEEIGAEHYDKLVAELQRKVRGQ